MKKIEISLFTFIALFLIPIYFSLNTIDSGLLPRFILLALFLLLVQLVSVVRIIKSGLSGRYTIAISALHLSLVGYVLFTILSISKAVNSAEALFEILKVMLFGAYIIVATRTIGRSDEVKIVVLKSIIVTSCIVGLMGILEYWDVIQLTDCERQPASTMGNRNLFSSFLFLSLGFVLFGVWRFYRFWYYTSLFTCGVILYVFLVTQTRAVWAACAVSVIITGAILVFIDRHRAIGFIRNNWRRVLSVVAIGIFLVVFHQQFKSRTDALPEVSERLATVLDVGFESNQQRLKMWGKTIKMIQEHLFLGVGAGNWKIILPQYGLKDFLYRDMTKITVRPHNDFLWVFAETGVFGFACFLGIFMIGGFYAIRSLRNAENRTGGSLSACLLFILIGYAVISFFDFPKERIAHLIYWGTVLSFLVSQYQPSLIERKVSARIIFVGHCMVILFSLVCLWIGCVRIKGDVHMISILNARRTGRWERLITEADYINTALYTMDHTSTPVYWYRGVANYSLNRIQDALHDFQQARAVHPYHIHVLNNLGSCYEVFGDHKQAEQWYLKALEISPEFDDALINLAVVYYNMKDYERAYTTIMRTDDTCGDPRRGSYIKAIEAKLREGENLSITQ